jgi:hypothetical protein
MRTMKYAIASLVLIICTATASIAQDYVWPRQRAEDGNVLVMYQPQVDNWRDFRELDWRMAVSFTPKGGKEAIGIVVLKGDTQVDNDRKIVFITNLNIVQTHFPSLDPAGAAQMDQQIRAFVPPAVSISLQQLVACVPKKDSVPGVQLKNDPPVIFTSQSPAILLDMDGKPMFVQIRNTGLEYAANTWWRLFRDKAKSQLYLLAGSLWLTAKDPGGPWTSTRTLPGDMKRLVADPMWADLKGYVPPPPPKANAVTPKVFYSTVPAEVILFDGKPVYARIPGTELMYATNTKSYVFYYAPGGRYYYLTAGRWFSATDLQGPWAFATSSLPPDFARIPPASPAGQVLASVPGTEEAKDAVLLAQIPTRVVVNPAAAAAQAKVDYSGPPEFVLIEGTSMSYAVNTQQKVIRVGDIYYLCLQGLWFVSTSPQGPWQTAQTVPQQIYSIPPSSPVYNVTYVTQTATPDGNVQASYTAGYMGAFVMGAAAGAVVAGGTGYYYPPVYAYPPGGYPVYHPYPATYGAMPYYNSATGAYGVSQTAYGPYGSATRTASYNPYTGTYGRTASASTAYGSAAVGQAYNPYTGAYGATKQGSNAYSQWGSSVVSKGGESAYTQHYSTAQGTVGSVQTSAGGKAVGSSTAYGNTAAAKTASGNVYAGHDGNVYKDTGSGWEKYDNGSWSSAQKPAAPSSTGGQRPAASQGAPAEERPSSFQRPEGGSEMDGLQREAQNRQRGEWSNERSQQMDRSRGGEGGWGGDRGWGGGFGGGRGRR